MTPIEVLVQLIEAKFKAGDFDKFIHDVTFPKFKSFAPGARIEFNFPIAVVVGPNGGGKSSLLHAVWGMPHKYSTSRFWFSTPVDPIYFVEGDQNRYWYSHYVRQIKQRVETRKTTAKKRDGYWERIYSPSPNADERRSLGDGLQRRAARWLVSRKAQARAADLVGWSCRSRR